MPTGYTAAVADGISFEEFVWTCARAFGALVMMRDESLGAAIPERFEPSSYHAEKLSEARAHLAALEAMSEVEAASNARADYDAALKRYSERLAENQALSDKYHAMLARVVQWAPPSPEHQGLKDFMAEQLRQSIDFDCSTKYIEAPVLLPASAWLGRQIEQAHKDVSYHAKAHAEEVERTESRNRWLADLRKSVPLPGRTDHA